MAEARERTGGKCDVGSGTEREPRRSSYQLPIRPHRHLVLLVLRRKAVVHSEVSTRRERGRDRGRVGEVETGQDRTDKRLVRNRNGARRAIAFHKHTNDPFDGPRYHIQEQQPYTRGISNND
jgi:hypothetical protein